MQSANLSPADRSIVDHLRRHQRATIGELIDVLGVTATAVRQRLTRLMEGGLVERETSPAAAGEAPDPVPGDPSAGKKRPARGRPGHCYLLTDKGRREAGDNYDDLVQVLWQEVRSIPDPAVRVGLVRRLASKLADKYSAQLDSDDLGQRMRDLVRLMGEREVPVDLDESGALPVLTMLACPYPTLAEQDRAVCTMEKAMIAEVLGQGVRLSECRLDGGGCCSFEASDPSTQAPPQPTAGD